MTNRILVVGVSQYQNRDVSGLPGVANDVREMAILLTSNRGNFTQDGMIVLTDQQATRDAIGRALDSVLGLAQERDTVLVYLAGHGALDADDAYFVPYDGDGANLTATCIQLSQLRHRFDTTRSRRVVLMLDSCHSGGVIARGETSPRHAVERAIRIIAGEGRVVLAACTATQFAYESAKTGHGDFTHAVLRGVRGEAADLRGEITIGGLFDFVDHAIGRLDQKPMYFGQLTGRLVLSYREARDHQADHPVKNQSHANTDAAGSAADATQWLLLGESFLRASECVENHPTIIVKARAPTPTEEHVLKTLRGKRGVPFAFGTTAGNADVKEVRSETDGRGHKSWHIELSLQSARSGQMEAGTSGYSAEDLAEMRARRLLTGEPRVGPRMAGGFDTVEMLVAGLGSPRVTESIFKELWPKLGTDQFWLKKARLVALHRLQSTQCVDDTLYLELVQNDKRTLHVRFEGERRQGFGGPSRRLRVEGDCQLPE